MLRGRLQAWRPGLRKFKVQRSRKGQGRCFARNIWISKRETYLGDIENPRAGRVVAGPTSASPIPAKNATDRERRALRKGRSDHWDIETHGGSLTASKDTTTVDNNLTCVPVCWMNSNVRRETFLSVADASAKVTRNMSWFISVESWIRWADAFLRYTCFLSKERFLKQIKGWLMNFSLFRSYCFYLCLNGELRRASVVAKDIPDQYPMYRRRCDVKRRAGRDGILRTSPDTPNRRRRREDLTVTRW